MNFKVKILHLFSCPRRFSQEFQARLYAWVFDKAINLNEFAEY